MKPAIRIAGGGFGGRRRNPLAGENPADGASIYYFLKEKPKGELKLRFLTASGKLVREVSSKPPAHADEAEDPEEERPRNDTLAPAKDGLNRYVWDLRYEKSTGFPGLLMWDGSLDGPRAIPGEYKVELVVDGKTESEKFSIVKDPRAPTTPEQFEEQLAFGLKIRDRVTDANSSVVRIRAMKDQLKPYLTRHQTARSRASAKNLTDQLTAIEENIYQTKLKAGEDALNFPIKLNNKIASVGGGVDMTDVAPTSQAQAVFDQLSGKLQVEIDHLHEIDTKGIPEFNKLVRDRNIPAVNPEPKSGPDKE